MYEILLQGLLGGFILSTIAAFATTVYLHRALTHEALKLRPIARNTFAFIIWLLTAIVPREWVAVHRKHHMHTDEEGDPHSPTIQGFWTVQLFNVLCYRQEAKNTETVKKHAPDIISAENWVDLNIFGKNSWIGPLSGTIALCLIFGIPLGVTMACFHAFLYVGPMSSSINGLCHSPYLGGYRNFTDSDRDRKIGESRNNTFFALFAAGEGLHNNHHADPTSALFSRLRREIDPGWWLVRLLELLGLAYDVRRPRVFPQPH